jgi:hypothetical protein
VKVWCSFVEVRRDGTRNITSTRGRTDLNQLESPAPMREEASGNNQPLDSAGSTIKSDAIEVVPAPMREDTTGNAQPLDRAWTNRMATIRVPAPRLELGTP